MLEYSFRRSILLGEVLRLDDGRGHLDKFLFFVGVVQSSQHRRSLASTTICKEYDKTIEKARRVREYTIF